MKKAKRFLTGLLSAALALSLCAMPAMADEGTVVDTSKPQKSTSVIDTTKKGSITIYKYNTTNQTAKGETGTGETQTPPEGATPLRGAEFTIYQVKGAEWLQTYYGGGALAKGEKAPEVDDYFNKENGVVISYEASNLVKGIADKAKGPQTTNDNGFAQFKDLDLGLYLVIETKKPQSVVTAVTPFLVSVPMTRVQTGDKATNGQLQEWLYDIVVYPKNSTVKGTFYLDKKGVIGNDKEHATALPGVKFQLERLNDGVDLTNTVTDDDWTLILPPQKDNEEQAEQKNYFVTDGNGKIQVDDLTPGTYRFTEIDYETNQDEKYIVNAGDHYVFIVNQDGKTVAKPDSENDNNDYVASNSTVTVYNYVPDVNKQVQKRGDENTWQEAADYNVGDMVPYKVTVTVPENITRLKTFTVTDTPTNLEDDVSTIKVLYINGETTTKLNETAAIKAIKKVNKGFEIQFDPAAMSDYAGKEIVITYQAKLLDTAVTKTEGNSNKVSLIYSKKVGTVGDPDTEEDKKTVQDETVVYTFKIKIIKTDENGKGLNGVEFDLYKKVPDGTENAITGNEAKAKGLDENEHWLKVNELPLTTNKVGEVDGILEVKGLANGTYKLVETKTLKDYNLLKEPVDVSLDIAYKTTWKVTNHYKDGVWVKRDVTQKNEEFETNEAVAGEEMNGGTKNTSIPGDGVISTTIINRKGFDLPTTGGFGTLLFSGIGVLLVVAGVGVLLSLKKKNRA